MRGVMEEIYLLFFILFFYRNYRGCVWRIYRRCYSRTVRLRRSWCRFFFRRFRLVFGNISVILVTVSSYFSNSDFSNTGYFIRWLRRWVLERLTVTWTVTISGILVLVVRLVVRVSFRLLTIIWARNLTGIS